MDLSFLGEGVALLAKGIIVIACGMAWKYYETRRKWYNYVSAFFVAWILMAMIELYATFNWWLRLLF